MDLDIRKHVVNNLKNDKENTILDTINESVTIGDELVLPGLGVLLELFWNELKKEEQIKIANIIKNKIQEK